MACFSINTQLIHYSSQDIVFFWFEFVIIPRHWRGQIPCQPAGARSHIYPIKPVNGHLLWKSDTGIIVKVLWGVYTVKKMPLSGNKQEFWLVFQREKTRQHHNGSPPGAVLPSEQRRVPGLQYTAHRKYWIVHGCVSNTGNPRVVSYYLSSWNKVSVVFPHVLTLKLLSPITKNKNKKCHYSRNSAFTNHQK